MHTSTDESPPLETLPRPAVERWLAPIQRFLDIEAAGGIVLLACAVLALAVANSPLAASFAAFWKTPVELSVGSFALSGTLGHLVVNDALMTIFFFVVGLEIKREMVNGELREPRRALLPAFAAVGGMILPALIYHALQWGKPGERGWAIPMATDIAFVVGFLALFGGRVPFGLKIFLLSLAIVDDLGAVLVIALVFTETLALGWLAAAAAGFAAAYLFNVIGVRRVGVYVVVGAFIWLAFLKAGVHPTIAGVLLGLLTPASAWIGEATLMEAVRGAWDRLRGDPDSREKELDRIGFVSREAVSPLQRLETALHPWVAFVIMPVFALANAGVALQPSALAEPVAVAVAAGLLIGKPAGILFFSFVAVRLRLTSLPAGVSWGMLAGAACLAGIGFTMALFLNSLAFPAPQHAESEVAGKVGTLAGSLLSAVVGSALLLTASRPPAEPEPRPEDDSVLTNERATT